ncbi:hypothetical protein WJU23_06630 [Prosthecobacter sp. SYSU 5D2]
MASLFEFPALAAMLVTAMVASAIVWWLQQKKIIWMQTRLDEERTDWKAELDAEKSAFYQQEALAQKALEKAAAELAAAEHRFSMHREAAQRRESDSLARIGRLETDLAAARETAALLPAAQARTGDLEATLTAERGRFSALEQTLVVTTLRGNELRAQLQEVQSQFTDHREKAQQREAALLIQLSEREQSLAADQARLATVDEETARLKELHSSYQSTAESRISSLQRQLAAAEAKSAMVQKEYMNAVGVLPPPPAADSPAVTDRRVSELEARLLQTEAEARKKGREDGYKIAELEYRLSEALEASAREKEETEQAGELEELRGRVKSLTEENESLVHDLETLKMVKARSVEPVPEVLEQGVLMME